MPTSERYIVPSTPEGGASDPGHRDNIIIVDGTFEGFTRKEVARAKALQLCSIPPRTHIKIGSKKVWSGGGPRTPGPSYSPQTEKEFYEEVRKEILESPAPDMQWAKRTLEESNLFFAVRPFPMYLEPVPPYLKSWLGERKQPPRHTLAGDKSSGTEVSKQVTFATNNETIEDAYTSHDTDSYCTPTKHEPMGIGNHPDYSKTELARGKALLMLSIPEDYEFVLGPHTTLTMEQCLHPLETDANAEWPNEEINTSPLPDFAWAKKQLEDIGLPFKFRQMKNQLDDGATKGMPTVTDDTQKSPMKKKTRGEPKPDAGETRQLNDFELHFKFREANSQFDEGDTNGMLAVADEIQKSFMKKKTPGKPKHDADDTGTTGVWTSHATNNIRRVKASTLLNIPVNKKFDLGRGNFYFSNDLTEMLTGLCREIPDGDIELLQVFRTSLPPADFEWAFDALERQGIEIRFRTDVGDLTEVMNFHTVHDQDTDPPNNPNDGENESTRPSADMPRRRYSEVKLNGKQYIRYVN